VRTRSERGEGTAREKTSRGESEGGTQTTDHTSKGAADRREGCETKLDLIPVSDVIIRSERSTAYALGENQNTFSDAAVTETHDAAAQ